jgi:hypothetical protein
MEHGEPQDEKVRTFSEERPGPEKERASKDDGRYIIFYTFEDEEAGETRLEEEGSG